VSDWARPKAYQAYLRGSGFLLLYTPPAVDARPGLLHSWRWYLKLCRDDNNWSPQLASVTLLTKKIFCTNPYFKALVVDIV
jgi:hypothetical protein